MSGHLPPTFTSRPPGEVHRISKCWRNDFGTGRDSISLLTFFRLEFKSLCNSVRRNPSFLGEPESEANEKHQQILITLAEAHLC